MAVPEEELDRVMAFDVRRRRRRMGLEVPERARLSCLKEMGGNLSVLSARIGKN